MAVLGESATSYNGDGALIMVKQASGDKGFQDPGNMLCIDATNRLVAMYETWLYDNDIGYKYINFDRLGGLFRSVTILANDGHGFLEQETGFHRYVSINPYDSMSRRWTVFVGVRVVRSNISFLEYLNLVDEGLSPCRSYDIYRGRITNEREGISTDKVEEYFNGNLGLVRRNNG